MDLLTNLSLFSGAGGLEQGARATGRIRTVCYIEIDRYAQAVLQSRIRDGRLDDAPIWDDVRTFDGKPWRGVDIISGGFPCQDVSQAGKRAGMGAGTRSGLWAEFHRVICEAQPRFVLVENVLGLLSIDTGRGFGTVLGDLAAAGYDAEWFVLSAADVGAPHRRERVWIVANANGRGCGENGKRKGLGGVGEKRENISMPATEPGSCCWRCEGEGNLWADGKAHYSDFTGPSIPCPECDSSDVANPSIIGRREGRSEPAGQLRPSGALGGGSPLADTNGEGFKEPARPGLGSVQESHEASARRQLGRGDATPREYWAIEPHVGRVAHGVAFRVDRLRCLGNGVVPQQSLPAWWKIIEKADRLERMTA